MAEEKGVLVCGELQEDKLAPVTLELLGMGRKLADELGGELGVVFTGDGLAEGTLREGIAFGADRVYAVDNPLLGDYQPDLHVAAMQQVCQELRPDIVLFGQTALGRDLAPRLAFRLGVGLAMDCVALAIDSRTGLLVRTKPVYGGNALANYVSEARPQMATVRAKAVAAAEHDSSRRGEIVALETELAPEMARTRVVARMEDREGAGKRLEAADVVVCGGRGMGAAENFSMLEELARLLQGAVGATRPPCDLGWVPCELQIGLSGKVIAPSLYIGVAVSGSSAHLAGCGNAKNIIAINNDPEANIFRVANYGIVADYKKVIPLIMGNYKRLAAA